MATMILWYHGNHGADVLLGAGARCVAGANVMGRLGFGCFLQQDGHHSGPDVMCFLVAYRTNPCRVFASGGGGEGGAAFVSGHPASSPKQALARVRA